jgi:putative transposase
LYLLLRQEQSCNHKRVERLYREAGLSLRRKKRKRLLHQAVRASAATSINEEWALDFVTDALGSRSICGF